MLPEEDRLRWNYEAPRSSAGPRLDFGCGYGQGTVMGADGTVCPDHVQTAVIV
jgi:hypothetical protein